MLWCKFYFSAWRSDPKLRMCSLAARGLWMEMLALMNEAEPYGHLVVNGVVPTDVQIAALAGAQPDQVPALVAELETAGVFSRSRNGTIYSRRMTRDERRRKDGKTAAKTGKIPGSRRSKQAAENVAEITPPPGVVEGVEIKPPPPLETRTLESEEESDATASPKTKGESTDGRRTGGSRGTRLPPDWEPDPADREFAHSLGVDPDHAKHEFRDFWIAQPGIRGTKVDWPATWRNRCRDIAKRQGSVRSQQPYAGRQESFGVVAALRNLGARAG